MKAGEGLSLVLKHVDAAIRPFADTPQHAVLIDLASSRPDADLDGLMERVLSSGLEEGDVEDAVVAQSVRKRTELWKLREEQPEAQKRAGESVRNDVSVPVAKVPELMRRASAAFRELVPGSRPAPFGHMGDGNIHMNLVQPEDMSAAEFLSHLAAIMDCVHGIVADLGGSFAAEHGIGRLKVGTLEKSRSAAELGAMRAIKDALDPRAIMNPGKGRRPIARRPCLLRHQKAAVRAELEYPPTHCVALDDEAVPLAIVEGSRKLLAETAAARLFGLEPLFLDASLQPLGERSDGRHDRLSQTPANPAVHPDGN
ncbi:FAD-binding oxidoreductase [Bradyrhizobium sp. NAS80.1]|uniref:FAD-binding oxidoreductase n=1 Tax=Bradyrhizobium sp. NAS80.1 TaxID=1680159 RepID=UPI0009FF0E2E|nr:FAD-binding oxidoreductase [Bradyrhizobium sp. NAS80.1]